MGTLLLWQRNLSEKTISRHAVNGWKTRLLFATILVVIGAIFYVWIILWLVPRLHLSELFISGITLVFICQVVVGIVSDTSGVSHKVHAMAAWTMSVLYIPLGFILVFASQISLKERIVAEILLAVMVFFAAMSVAVGKRQSRLYFQTSYIVTFQLLILTVAYL